MKHLLSIFLIIIFLVGCDEETPNENNDMNINIFLNNDCQLKRIIRSTSEYAFEYNKDLSYIKVINRSWHNGDTTVSMTKEWTFFSKTEGELISNYNGDEIIQQIKSYGNTIEFSNVSFPKKEIYKFDNNILVEINEIYYDSVTFKTMERIQKDDTTFINTLMSDEDQIEVLAYQDVYIGDSGLRKQITDIGDLVLRNNPNKLIENWWNYEGTEIRKSSYTEFEYVTNSEGQVDQMIKKLFQWNSPTLLTFDYQYDCD